ncbi:unnamed protein product [Caenorhabditis bovis]|uniref:Uncharacterized protein n=1 Tax=Caenorhabditis bovis TaxID=2654633 RepID=A0A8S1FCJ8_9PELO|nr:unnamed protein product [Caenorhabditis bovis]
MAVTECEKNWYSNYKELMPVRQKINELACSTYYHRFTKQLGLATALIAEINRMHTSCTKLRHEDHARARELVLFCKEILEEVEEKAAAIGMSSTII